MLNLADPALMKYTPDQLHAELNRRMLSVAYFRQLFLFDDQGNPITGYPQMTLDEIQATDEEETSGVGLALRGQGPYLCSSSSRGRSKHPGIVYDPNPE